MQPANSLRRGRSFGQYSKAVAERLAELRGAVEEFLEAGSLVTLSIQLGRLKR